MNLLIQKYFRLNPECHFIKGDNRSAIYNLLSGDIISIESSKTKILIACEKGKSVEDIINSTESISKKECVDFLEKLIEKKAGSFYKKNIYVKKYGDRDPWRSFSPVPPVLYLGFIEFTNICELECFFCRDDGIQPFYKGCMGCKKWLIDVEKQLRIKDWGKVLSQLNDLGCRDLMIVGGNPFLAENKLKGIIKQIRSLNFQRVFISTNGIFLSENTIKFLKKYLIYPVIQVFSYESKEYELITGKSGGFDILINNLRRLKENDLKFSITILVSHITQYNIEKIRKFFEGFSPENIFFNYLYPTSKNLSDFTSEYTEKLVISKKNIPRTSLEDFSRKRDYHPCLNGKIAITAEGNILPCIMMRDEIIGNIKDSSLQEFFADKKVDLYWELCKEKVDICKECEYRYACPDCRPLEKNATSNLYKNKYCAYDPKKGEWKDN